MAPVWTRKQRHHHVLDHGMKKELGISQRMAYSCTFINGVRNRNAFGSLHARGFRARC